MLNSSVPIPLASVASPVDAALLSIGLILFGTTLIWLAAAGVCRLLRQRSAASRHLVWSLSTIAVGLAWATHWTRPVGSIAVASLPQQRVTSISGETTVRSGRDLITRQSPFVCEVPEASARQPGPTTSGFETTGFETASAAPTILPGAMVSSGSDQPPAAIPAADPFPSSRKPTAEATTAGRTASAVVRPLAAFRSSTTPMNRLATVLATIWLTGAGLLASVMIWSVARHAWCRRTWRPIGHGDWDRQVRAVARELGLRRSVRSFAVDQPVVPAVFGVLRPSLVVPSDWREWTPIQTRSILLHELAHVSRHDILMQWFARLVATLNWFHPLAWVAARQMRLEREAACDDLVLAAGVRPSDYADCLLDVVRRYTPIPMPIGVAMACSSPLQARMRHMLAADRDRHPVSRRQSVVSLAVAGCAALIIGSLSIATAAEPAALVQTATEPTTSENDAPGAIGDQLVTLTGRVVRPDESPAVDVTLYAVISEKLDPIRLGTTGDDGRYEFRIPADRLIRTVAPSYSTARIRASLVAVADGYGPAWTSLPSADGNRFGPMKRRYKNTLTLVANAGVAGQLVDDDGRAVVGATVSVSQVHRLDDGVWWKMSKAIETNDIDLMTRKEADVERWVSSQYRSAWRTLPSATTDADGRFELTGIGADRAAVLSIRGPGIVRETVAVLTRDDATDFTAALRKRFDGEQASRTSYSFQLFGSTPTITIPRTRTVAGRITDEVTGEPIAGANVRVRSSGRSGYRNVDTDEDGRYRVTRRLDDSAETITLLVRDFKQRYLAISRVVDAADKPGELTVDLRLPRATVVRGTVVEAGTGKPIVSDHRQNCDDVQPGPLVAGYATYHPLHGNTLEGTSADGDPIAFATNRNDRSSRVAIGADGTFTIAIPPGPGVLLVEAKPPLPMFPRSPIEERYHDNFPYRTLRARARQNAAEVTFPGRSKPIDAGSAHAYKLLDPGSEPRQIEQRFEIPKAPSVAMRFVRPDGLSSGLFVHRLPSNGIVFGSSPTMAVKSSDLAVTAYHADTLEGRELIAITDDKAYAAVWTFSDAEPVTTIPMRPTGSISFRLLDEATGQPLVGYSVRPSYETDPKLFLWFQMGTPKRSGPDGRLTIDGILPDQQMSLNLVSPKPDEARAIAAGHVAWLEQGYLPKDLKSLSLEPSAFTINAPGGNAARATPPALSVLTVGSGQTLDLGDVKAAPPIRPEPEYARGSKYRGFASDRYFPSSVEGGRELDALFIADDRDERSDEEVLRTVRQGFRNTTQHRTSILRWVGNRMIWNQSPQSRKAIELMYHAADPMATWANQGEVMHYAVYFGLSVVKQKGKALLRGLAEIAMRTDSADTLSRIAWGTADQRADFLEQFAAFREPKDERTRQIAAVRMKIMTGELSARQWADERQRQKVVAQYGDVMGRIRERLRSGVTAERRKTLELILRDRVYLAMDDSFAEAFVAASDDDDADVRNLAVIIAGTKWCWRTQAPPEPIREMMLARSRDQAYEVRYNAVYYGLSVFAEKSDETIDRMREMLKSADDPNMRQRLTWGLRGEAGKSDAK